MFLTNWLSSIPVFWQWVVWIVGFDAVGIFLLAVIYPLFGALVAGLIVRVHHKHWDLDLE